MSTKAAMVEHLRADANVTALVGTNVYQMPAPSGTPVPYIAVSQLGGDEVLHATGDSGLAEETGDIFCVDDNQEDAFTVADTVRIALPIRGTIGAGGNTISARRLSLGRPVDDQTSPTKSGDRGRFAARIPWHVWLHVAERSLT